MRAVRSGAILGLVAAAGCATTTTELNIINRDTSYVKVSGQNPAAPCAGIPIPPEPTAWWAGLDPNTRAKNVVAGLQIWSDCQAFRQDMYRGRFAYDVTPLNALSTSSSPITNRMVSAKLRIQANGGLVDRSTNGAACPRFSGGAGSVGRALFEGGTANTGMNAATPAGDSMESPGVAENLVALGSVPVPGTLGRATASVGGQGLTIYEIDVKDAVARALNTGNTFLPFVITGTTEHKLVLGAPVQLDCRTFVVPLGLTVVTTPP